METDNMKNMVVIKNLPSNIVEEAIVILKPNIKLKNLDTVEKNGISKKVKKEKIENPKNYIINEAEMVVGNYLSKLEDNKNKNIKINKKIEMKCKRLKIVSIIFGIMFLASILIK